MPDERNVHCFPVDDIIDHDTDHFDECICGPDVEFVEGGRLVVHHSLDGRELSEPGYGRRNA